MGSIKIILETICNIYDINIKEDKKKNITIKEITQVVRQFNNNNEDDK